MHRALLLMCGAGSLSLGVWWADRAAYRGKHLHSRGRSRGTRTQNRWTSGTWRTTNTPCLSTRHPTWRLFLSSSARAAAASRPFGGTERRRAVGSLGSVSKARAPGGVGDGHVASAASVVTWRAACVARATQRPFPVDVGVTSARCGGGASRKLAFFMRREPQEHPHRGGSAIRGT